MITISSGALSAEIDPMGAELHSLRDGQGRDLLWNGDPAFWTGRAPLLFPIVGAVNGGQYRLDGRAYPMAKHGFARRSLFEVTEATPASAAFRLADSHETRQVYPFAFRLDVRFEIAGPTLTMRVVVSNPSDRPLPASFGFHPAFRWPLPGAGARADQSIIFDEDETAPIRRVGPDGLVRAAGEPSPVEGRRLRLRDGLFEDDALIFERPASRGLRYGGQAGPGLRIDYPDLPYLGVWTKPGAGFIAIEPWAGIADPVGYEGDFRDKPGVFVVAPGAERAFEMSVALKG
jgi:galactose mutarotase-like enzyme